MKLLNDCNCLENDFRNYISRIEMLISHIYIYVQIYLWFCEQSDQGSCHSVCFLDKSCLECISVYAAEVIVSR